MISAAVAEEVEDSHRHGHESWSDGDDGYDDFSCRTDLTTVKVSNPRRVTVRGFQRRTSRFEKGICTQYPVTPSDKLKCETTTMKSHFYIAIVVVIPHAASLVLSFKLYALTWMTRNLLPSVSKRIHRDPCYQMHQPARQHNLRKACIALCSLVSPYAVAAP